MLAKCSAAPEKSFRGWFFPGEAITAFGLPPLVIVIS
jgi:hypothetical protein